MKKVIIEIKGMHCASCANHVKKELKKLNAKEINVNPVTNKAYLQVDESISEKKLKNAVTNAGYTPLNVIFEGEELKKNIQDNELEYNSWKKN